MNSENSSQTDVTDDTTTANNDGAYGVEVTHEEHGFLGYLDDTFDSQSKAEHAAFDAQIREVGIITDVVPVSGIDIKSDTDTETDIDSDTGDTKATEAMLWTDGASRGNPGPAAGGVVLELPGGEEITDNIVFDKDLTNNQAEYRALLYGLSVANMYEVSDLSIFLDSELVVKQLTGEYSVNDDTLAKLKAGVDELLNEMSWDVKHVPRKENKDADKLANAALDRR